MANQVGVALHTPPGDQILVPTGAHVRQWESSGVQANSGVAVREVAAGDGAMSTSELAASLAGWEDPHIGPDALVGIENTFNGNLVPLDHQASVIELARNAGSAVHLDGARLFNAAIAAGVEPADVAAGVDTVSFCFSKGLGAPVGSVICGSAELIHRAKWIRKRLGGGMRQVGVLAAAARLALSEWRRLADDHELAQYLASGLRELLGDGVADRIDSNMVFVSASDDWEFGADRLVEAWAAADIKSGLIADGVIRLVCHRDVDREDVDRLLDVTAATLNEA